METTITVIEKPLLYNSGDYAMLDSATDDGRLIAMWLAKKRSPHTKAQYQRSWQQFSAYVGLSIQQITYNDLQQWAQSLAGAPNTIKTHIASIKSLFAFAQKTGYIRINPASMLDSVKTGDRKHTRILSEADIHAMITVTTKPRDKAIIRTLYSAGCRISELCALTWADVVPTTKGKATLMIMGKGEKQREAGISADTYSLLLELRQAAHDTAPVFPSKTGRHLLRNNVWAMIKDAAKTAGIKKAPSPHWFRHSHVSHALARGANPEAIRQQVGHASLATTTGYAHSDETSADYLSV